MARTEAEPELVEGDSVMPLPVVLNLEQAQESSRHFDSVHFLSP
jgi:hypothetical protein